jgi:hypothetical protein
MDGPALLLASSAILGCLVPRRREATLDDTETVAREERHAHAP